MADYTERWLFSFEVMDAAPAVAALTAVADVAGRAATEMQKLASAWAAVRILSGTNISAPSAQAATSSGGIGQPSASTGAAPGVVPPAQTATASVNQSIADTSNYLDHLKMRIQTMAEWFAFYEVVHLIGKAIGEWSDVQAKLSVQMAQFQMSVDQSRMSLAEYRGEVMRISQESAANPAWVAENLTLQARIPASRPDIAERAAQVARMTPGADTTATARTLISLTQQYPEQSTLQILDSFSGAWSKSALTMKEFFTMMDTAAPAAKEFNTTLSDMMGFLAGVTTVANTSTQSVEQFTRRMGTVVYSQGGFRSLVERFTGKPSEEIDTKTGELVRTPLTDIFRNIAALPQDQITQIAAQIQNQLGQPTRQIFMAIMQSWQNVDAAMQKAATSQGQFLENFNKSMDTYDAKLQAVTSSWQRLMTAMGNTQAAKQGLDVVAAALDTIRDKIENGINLQKLAGLLFLSSIPGAQALAINLAGGEFNQDVQARLKAQRDAANPPSPTARPPSLADLGLGAPPRGTFWAPGYTPGYTPFAPGNAGPGMSPAPFTSGWTPAQSDEGLLTLLYNQGRGPNTNTPTRAPVWPGQFYTMPENVSTDQFIAKYTELVNKAVDAALNTTDISGRKVYAGMSREGMMTQMGITEQQTILYDKTANSMRYVYENAGYAAQALAALGQSANATSLTFTSMPQNVSIAEAESAVAYATSTVKAYYEKNPELAPAKTGTFRDVMAVTGQGQVLGTVTLEASSQKELSDIKQLYGQILSDTGQQNTEAINQAKQQTSLLRQIAKATEAWVDKLIQPTKVTTAEELQREYAIKGETNLGPQNLHWDEPVRRNRAAVDARIGLVGGKELYEKAWGNYAMGQGIDLTNPATAASTLAEYERKYYNGLMGQEFYNKPNEAMGGKSPIDVLLMDAQRTMEEETGRKNLTQWVLQAGKAKGVNISEYVAKQVTGESGEFDKAFWGAGGPETAGANVGKDMKTYVVPELDKAAAQVNLIGAITSIKVDPADQRLLGLGSSIGKAIRAGIYGDIQSSLITDIVNAVIARLAADMGVGPAPGYGPA